MTIYAQMEELAGAVLTHFTAPADQDIRAKFVKVIYPFIQFLLKLLQNQPNFYRN